MNTKTVAQNIFDNFLKNIDNEGMHDFVTDDNVFFKYWYAKTPEPAIIIFEIYENDIEQPVEEVQQLFDEILFDFYILND